MSSIFRKLIHSRNLSFRERLVLIKLKKKPIVLTMAAPGSYPQPGADDHFKQPAEPSSNGRTVTYGPPQQSGNNHSQNDSHRRQERRDGSSSRDRSRSRSKDKARQTSSERRSGSERDQPSGERRSGSERDGQGGERRSGFGRGRGQSQGQQLNVGTWNSSHHQGHYNKQTQYQSYKSQQNYYGSYHNQGQGSQYHRNANGQWSADDYTFLSKTLSSILRHNAERFGLKLMKGGFLYVDDILKGVKNLRGFTLEDVQKVVEENDKKRFALEQEGNKWKVRANQGHSIEVDGLDLKPVTSTDDFPIVIHGTYYEAWEKIKNTGLKRMTRNHIHFAVGEPGQNGVISGMRSSCEVIIYLDLDKALKDGLKFFQSANNVILCEGDKDGYIYPCYFSGVLDRKNRSRLDFDHTICSVPGKKDKPGKSNEQSPKKNKRNKKKNKNKEDEDLEADGATSRNGSDRNQDDDDDNVVFQEEPTSKPDVEMPDATDKDNTAGEEKGNESKCCDMKSDNEVTATTDSWNVDKQVVEGVRGSMEDMDVNTDETKEKWDEEEEENTGDKLDWGNGIPNFLTTEKSVEVVESLLAKPPSYVVVCCVGENLSQANGRISTIVILAHPDIYVYHLCDDNSKLVKDGKLKSLLLGQVEKVFFDVGTVSRALIREFDVLLNGTPIRDIEMVFDKVKLANMDLEELKQSYGFNGSFKKWRNVNETCGVKLGFPDIDYDSLTQVIDQGKCIAQLYKYCKEKLNPEIIPAIKKMIYKAAIPEGDEELGEKVKALLDEYKKQKQANKGTDQQQAKPAENKQQSENKQGGKQGAQHGGKKKSGLQGGGNSKKGRGKKH